MRTSVFGVAWVAIGLSLSAVTALSQEVRIGELNWIRAPKEPEAKLPEFKSRPSVDYPDVLRKEEIFGYAIVAQFIGKDGKLGTLRVAATHPNFEKAVTSDHARSFRPALLNGQPIDSDVWYCVVFNPKIAAENRAERPPRVLQVTPILVKRKQLPPNVENLLVESTISIDEKGVAQAIVLAGPNAEAFKPLIEAELPHWRFDAARKAGQPVAGELHLVVLLQASFGPMHPPKGTPPKAIRQEKPKYPMAMRRSGLKGEVMVSFVVTKDGNVSEAAVVRSNNPAFDQPALDAILRWKFTPAIADGKAVETKMMIPMIFELPQLLDGGNDYAEVVTPSKKNFEKLPEQYRFDVAPKPKNIIRAIYPYPLLRDGVSGNATVVYMVDLRGRVTDIKIVEASHPEFGLALAAAVGEFEFEPALRKGSPTVTLLSIKQEFAANGFTDGPREEDLAVLKREKKHPEEIVGPKALDQPLKPISRKSPTFPGFLDESIKSGRAVIEMIIDEEGCARVPRIVEASDPAFGYAAAQAAADWRFERPTRERKSVLVRIQVPFVFNREQPKPAASSPPAQP